MVPAISWHRHQATVPRAELRLRWLLQRWLIVIAVGVVAQCFRPASRAWLLAAPGLFRHRWRGGAALQATATDLVPVTADTKVDIQVKAAWDGSLWRSLGQAGDALVAVGKHSAAVTKYQAAAIELDSYGEPKLRSAMRMRMKAAGALMDAGRPDQALLELDRVLQGFLAQGKESLKTMDGAGFSMKKGAVLAELGHHRAALGQFKGALRTLKFLGATGTRNYARVLTHLGECKTVLPYREEAVEALKEARQFYEADGTLNSTEGARTLYHLGVALAKTGLLVKGREAIKVFELLRSFDHPDTNRWTVTVYLGDLYARSGNFSAALSEYEAARAIDGGKSSSVMTKISGIHLEMGDMETALDIAEEAKEILAERRELDTTREGADLYLQVATILRIGLGDQRGLVVGRQVQRILNELFGARRALEHVRKFQSAQGALIMEGVGDMLVAVNYYKEALECYQQAVQMRSVYAEKSLGFIIDEDKEQLKKKLQLAEMSVGKYNFDDVEATQAIEAQRALPEWARPHVRATVPEPPRAPMEKVRRKRKSKRPSADAARQPEGQASVARRRQQDDVLDVPDEPSSLSSKTTTEEVKRKPARRVLKLRKFSRSELQGEADAAERSS